MSVGPVGGGEQPDPGHRPAVDGDGLRPQQCREGDMRRAAGTYTVQRFSAFLCSLYSILYNAGKLQNLFKLK